MSKRMIKDQALKEAIHNIAEDFRFSNELDEIARMFYSADTEHVVRGGDIEKMKEYVDTGLAELKQHIQWKEEFLKENPQADEARVVENMKAIEREYTLISEFLG